MNFNTIKLILIVNLLMLYLFAKNTAFAQSENSSQYKLQNEIIDIVNLNDNPDNSTTGFLDPLEVSQLKKNGYVVTSSVEDLADSLQLTLSNETLNFGPVTASNTYQISSNMELNSRKPHIFQISLIQENPFVTLMGEKIENTLCDNSSNPCTDKIAKPWKLSTNTGVGYTVSGIHTPSDFKDKNYYRIFPGSSQGDQPATLSFNQYPLTQEGINLNLKLQTTSDQKESTYTSVINMIVNTSY